MLEGLATIDWSKLQQAYGEASQVPDLLRAALSSDNRVREAAISGLFCTIYHQGTVYSASPFAVPFLFEMLESDATPDKAQIASLLAMMANGQSYLAVHSTLGPFTNHALHTVVADQGKNWEDEVQKEMNWADQTRQAVGEKIELLFPFYASADWDTRAAMTVAFVNYPTHAKKLIPLFRQGLAVEEKPEIRRLIKLAIKEVQRQVPNFSHKRPTRLAVDALRFAPRATEAHRWAATQATDYATKWIEKNYHSTLKAFF